MLTAVLSLTTSLSVVNRQNARTSLEKQVYALKSDIETMEQENLTLKKKIDEDERRSYREIYKKARSLGMVFPKNGQIKTYHTDRFSLPPTGGRASSARILSQSTPFI